ncbi:endonuclease [Polaribacter sp. Hel_I_88]|uniref:endonuclease n=1 Tax=Polaribacter sp. Hel_I_88 TaxID=1250006 RepID=UPI000A62B269|nr:endonuclease [Polaribacter sp. Hel_I_88]
MIKKNILLLCILSSTFSFAQQTYYNDVNLNLTGLTLKEELATKIISTHSQFLFYDQIWGASKITDVNPSNNQQVLLIYGFENGSDADVTNDRVRGIDNNSGNSGDWNREHVFSQSLGTPPLSDAGPGSDAHHLRPADAQRNSSRNNRKFTTGSGFSGIQQNGGWFPGDEWKGDVARMMMYMYVRYNNRCLPTNIGIGDNSTTPDDMIDLFLQWNVDDPVSDFEKKRNTYHENTTNQNAQGNRNPFIDNPILATRIWGGTKAEDSWGIYTSNDSQAPSTPTNLTISNNTTFSIDLSWEASTDNVAVSSYDVFLDGNLFINTTNTSVTINQLNSDTNYTFTVLAKDIVNNTSAQSEAISESTLKDTEAPSIPSNITISNETTTSFVVSWDAATDNTAVLEYEVFLDGNIITSVSETMFTVTNLATATSYSVQILAIDKVGNKSDLSDTIIATTNSNNTNATEIFFSEYLEGSSNNKALELVNLTDADIDLSPYSIKRQSNGGLNGAEWEFNFPLSGKTIKSQDVFVIVNEAAGEHPASKSQKGRIAGDFLIAIADSIRVHNGDTNFGAPLNFNGDDPIGLFKNDILIDIIGTYNSGQIAFGIDKTLRRKINITQPNINFDLSNEWDVVDKDNADDFGQHSAIVLSTTSFSKNDIQFYPNPVKDFINITNKTNREIKHITIYNMLGKKVFFQKNPTHNINIKKISKGIYMLTFEVENKMYKSKIIKY